MANTVTYNWQLHDKNSPVCKKCVFLPQNTYAWSPCKMFFKRKISARINSRANKLIAKLHCPFDSFSLILDVMILGEMTLKLAFEPTMMLTQNCIVRVLKNFTYPSSLVDFCENCTDVHPSWCVRWIWNLRNLQRNKNKKWCAFFLQNIINNNYFYIGIHYLFDNVFWTMLHTIKKISMWNS